MTFFATISLIITVAAIFGYANQKWLKLPATVTALNIIFRALLKDFF